MLFFVQMKNPNPLLDETCCFFDPFDIGRRKSVKTLIIQRVKGILKTRPKPKIIAVLFSEDFFS